MKIFNYIVSAAFGTLAMTSCTDLSEKLYDQVASENYYNTKNYSLDNRRWHQRQPAYVWGYPDSCLKEAADMGASERGAQP